MSGIINKVKAKVEEMKADHKTSGSTNAGPHDSNAANKADPRVDSNLDGRGVGHGTTGTHSGTGLTGSHQTIGTTGTHSGTGLTGSHHTTGTGSGLTSSHTSNTTAGPHDSNMANKLDPRVDSDLSGGHAGSNAQYTTTGTTGHSSSGIGSTHPVTSGGITGNHSSSSTTAGPHSNNTLNKLDPRVDSDLSGGHPGSNAGYTSTGTTGTSSGFTSGTSNTYGSTNAGPHDSNFANKADPRVDSDLDGGRHAGLNQTTGTHSSTGFGSNTQTAHSSTGPVHNSNLLNKIDPRVDSTPGSTTHNNQY